MKIQFYANACFSLFHNGKHILCDPWISKPSVGGNWYAFPPLKTTVADIPKPDYLYVSHVHSDHCEEQTLKDLGTDIPVIIMERKPDFIEGYLRELGFQKIIKIPEGPAQEIPDAGFKVKTFPSVSTNIQNRFVDSSVLFDFGDLTVLNCNDNTPNPEFCRELQKEYPQIDVVFLSASGGGAYPSMYENLSVGEKAALSKEIVRKYTDNFIANVNALIPRVVIPVAGGYAIGGKYAEIVNYQQPRSLHKLELKEYCQGKIPASVEIIPMQDGMSALVEKDSVTISGKYIPLSDAETESYFKKLAALEPERKVITTHKVKNLWNVFNLGRSNLWKRQHNLAFFPEYRIYFEVKGREEVMCLDFTVAETKLVKKSEYEEPYLTIKLDQDTLLEWLLGLEDFNMLDSGHRMLYDRRPNTYVQEAYVLLSLLRV